MSAHANATPAPKHWVTMERPDTNRKATTARWVQHHHTDRDTLGGGYVVTPHGVVGVRTLWDHEAGVGFVVLVYVHEGRAHERRLPGSFSGQSISYAAGRYAREIAEAAS